VAELVSLRAYARSRRERGLPGGTHAAVRKAIAAGRLERAVVVREGKPSIEPELADAEWERRTDATMSRGPEQSGDPTAGRPGGSLDDAPAFEARASSDSGVAEQARRAQAVRLTFQAKLAELEYRQRSGELVRAEDVRLEQSRAARAVRDRLRALPDSSASLLAAETDPHRVRALLSAQIDRILADLARQLREPEGAPA